MVRRWRQRRRLSQLDLAGLAETSTRHLSYVETGRARPSRDMVLRLAAALEVPLREANQMLLGAGLAPAYPDARTDHAARAALLDVLDEVLDGHLPNPALVLDAEFDVVAANAAVDRMLGTLVDPDLLDPPVNVVRVTLHPRGLARHLGNLGPWRAHLLRQVRRHATAAPSQSLDALLAEAEQLPTPRTRATARTLGLPRPTPARSRCRCSCTSGTTRCAWSAPSPPSAPHSTWPPASWPSRPSCPPTPRPAGG